MVRLLYIHPGSVPPPRNESHDRFHFLSQICGGAVLLPVWWRTRSEAIEKFGSYPTYERGRFTYHFFLDMRWRGVLGTAARTAFFVRQAARLHRATGPFDAVMTYGTNSTGVASMLVSRLLRTRLIAEIPGVPEDAYLFDEPRVRSSHRLKHEIAQRAARLVLTRADHAKLLYPTQLASYPALSKLPTSIFHDFVPVAGLDPAAPDGRNVLFLGHPWYLKGVDVLIRAFRSIAERVPDYRLRIIGHFPDRAYLRSLAQGCEQIDFLPAIKHSDALAAISSCSLLVLPSRSEGMGRVLLEAMAAAKPIIGTRVGGIPHYVHDGENGFLVTPGSVDELSTRMLEVLQDPALARRLGDRGRQLAMSKYDEQAFVRHFAEMFTRMGFGVPSPHEPRHASAERQYV